MHVKPSLNWEFSEQKVQCLNGDKLFSLRKPNTILWCKVACIFILAGRTGRAERPEQRIGRLYILHKYILTVGGNWHLSLERFGL